MTQKPGSVLYDEGFYSEQRHLSYMSASVMVPHVLRVTGATSIVDFGCGVGTWLRAFQENGAKEILGLDGKWVEANRLEIDRADFQAVDLQQPIHLKRRHDLAVCLEVAEHLPPECSEQLVESLVAAAPLVLFSAAIPGQGGIDHINEQWQDHWVTIFCKRKYLPLDIVRPLIWENERVGYWYRQNTLLFVDSSHALSKSSKPTWSYNRIHPCAFEAIRGQLARANERLQQNNSDSGISSLRMIGSGLRGVASAVLRRIGH